MMLNSGPWSLFGQSISYIIKLAPILWWALPSGPAVFQPKPTNASTYAWLPDTQENPNTALLVLRARINCGMGFSPSILVFGTLNGLSRKLQNTVSRKPPLTNNLSLTHWQAKVYNLEQEQIKEATRHLKARYAVSDPVYVLNPTLAKLEPNHLRPFKVAAVYDNHTYQL
ncbi:hypothetical protein DSO57_1026852 [Entomophthora muscae]|uniref:Uncharacterized protein n=1 Tax=Entomophthora muscae TaxID=34485 RepID=A0ACC2SEH8_9FUNG|nr:hypothetical protein DSO57_1026852 [Entomophthora muscae]